MTNYLNRPGHLPDLECLCPACREHRNRERSAFPHPRDELHAQVATLTKERDEARALLLEEQALRHDYGTRLARAEVEHDALRGVPAGVDGSGALRLCAPGSTCDLNLYLKAKARAEKAEAEVAQKCVELDALTNPWRDP